MNTELVTLLTWLLSIMSVAMLWLMGNKSRWGPILGLVNQAAWIIYEVITHQWGLMAGTLCYTVVHIRNIIKWSKE